MGMRNETQARTLRAVAGTVAAADAVAVADAAAVAVADSDAAADADAVAGARVSDQPTTRKSVART